MLEKTNKNISQYYVPGLDISALKDQVSSMLPDNPKRYSCLTNHRTKAFCSIV